MPSDIHHFRVAQTNQPTNQPNRLMYTETIELTNGYTARIANDTDAQNPFSDWDCEPPIAVLNWQRYHAKLENYEGDELDLSTLLDLIPVDKWTSRTGKREIMAALPFPMNELKEEIRDTGNFQDAIMDMAGSLIPDGWSEWIDYFDAMKAVAAVAGIPCHLTQSNGNSQGDSALLFVAATPAWAQKVGAPTETLKGQCEGACKLWADWAWGNVYGVQAIIDPDGEELDDGSCWGFYGDNHGESGLLDHCAGYVNYELRQKARAITPPDTDETVTLQDQESIADSAVLAILEILETNDELFELYHAFRNALHKRIQKMHPDTKFGNF